MGLRHRPGRFALVLFRMPLRAYHHGKGWLLGHTFMLLTHVGRRTGLEHDTALMVLRYRRRPLEVVVCSAWGPEADWVQNISERTASRVQVGRDSFAPEQRFLSAEEGRDVLRDCLSRHPWRFRFIATLFGWGDLRTEGDAREFVRTRPFVSFRPVADHPAA